MAKYLDSKGLSYLWQKIVHRFAQRDLNNSTKLVNGNIAVWTDAHKLSGITQADLTSSVLSDKVIGLPNGSLVEYVVSGIGTDNKSGWELPKASSSTFGVVSTESTVSDKTGLTAVPIIDGKLYYRDGADYTHPVLNISKQTATESKPHGGTFTVVDSLSFAETQEGGAEKGHLIGYTTKTITLPAGYVHPTPTPNDTVSTATPAHGGTFTVVDSVSKDTQGHVTGVNTKTVTLPAGYVHPTPTPNDTVSTATPEHGGIFTVIDSVTRDTQGHVTGVNTKTVTLPTVTIPEVVHPVVGVNDSNQILHLDEDKELYTSLKLNKVTETDGTLKIQILGSKSGSFPEGDIVSGTDYPLVTELDLTELTKDSFLKSATIHTLSTGANSVNVWDVTPSGGTLPTTPGTYIRFEWNTREDDKDTTDKVETTVEYLDVTRLVSMYTAGNGIDISNYTGNDGKGKNAKSISVKVDNTAPSDGSTLVTLATGTNGLSAKVDLSGYQKSSDLQAFTKDELDDIFDAADALYAAETNGDKTKTKNTPAFPEVDPLSA